MMKKTFLLVSGVSLAILQGGCLEKNGTGIKYDYKASEVDKLCETTIKNAEVKFDAIAKSKEARTFKTAVVALEEVMGELDDIISPLYLLKEVSLAPDVQKAAGNCMEKFESLMARTKARPDLFAAVSEVANQKPTLDTQDQKLLDETMLMFRLSGAALKEDVRNQIVKLKEELSKAELEFRENITNANDTVAMNEADLEGIPKMFVDSWPKDDKGNRLLSLTKAAHSVPFMQNAKSEAARRKYTEAAEKVVAEKNIPLLERALKLRHQVARLMGFKDHADLVLQTRMAKTSEEVLGFLEDLRLKLRPKVDGEVKALLALKKKDDPSAAALNLWDWRYYDNQLAKTQYAVDDALVREYFPMEHVVESVLGVYETILGVDFEEVTPAKAWSPDVRLFATRDKATKKIVSHFYLDLFPRENKYNHFAAFTIRSGRETAKGYQTPVSSVVGNWPKPSKEQPSLLSHQDVETFFHEFGHIMHQTLTTARYTSFAGSAVKRDFVEAPSQMLENWAWHSDILKKVSKHYKTGEPLPADLQKKMIDAKLLDIGLKTSRQIFFAKTDMQYHTGGETVDTTAIWHKNMVDIFTVPATRGGKPQATFGHLMGGYDAGYYGYLWSEVFAADMFTAFEQGGLESAEVGGRYRKWILEPGGSIDPGILIRSFLGREPNSDAFLKSLGLDPSAVKKNSSELGDSEEFPAFDDDDFEAEAETH